MNDYQILLGGVIEVPIDDDKANITAAEVDAQLARNSDAFEETRQCERCDEDKPDAEMRTKEICNDCAETEADRAENAEVGR